MTLEGTNTYVLAAPGADTVVIVDPGFGDGAADHAAQVANVVGDRKVELILITHHHLDHTGAADTTSAGAPVRAVAEHGVAATSLIADEMIMAMEPTVWCPRGTHRFGLFFCPTTTPPAPGGPYHRNLLGQGTTMLIIRMHSGRLPGFAAHA